MIKDLNRTNNITVRVVPVKTYRNDLVILKNLIYEGMFHHAKNVGIGLKYKQNVFIRFKMVN